MRAEKTRWFALGASVALVAIAFAIGAAWWMNGAAMHQSGGPQLIAAEPLPEMDGAMCQWETASASTTLARALAKEADAKDAMGSRTSALVDRVPLRSIHDSYPTYSAVGVDLTTNEAYLQDENLFGLLVFDRETNTPPSAKMSEPKRRIRGNETRLEFNCSLWIDPKNGDVYSVNNDMVDRMVVFQRGAAGNGSPKRQLHTPHRAFGIAVDEEAQELFLTIQHAPQVVVYRKDAKDEDKPVRILRGEKTQLADVHGIALDTKNQLMYVANHGAASGDKTGLGGRFDAPSITVYPLKANGDVAPLRKIQGPKAGFNWPALMYLDQERGELYVANDMDNSILVFNASDQGDIAPIRTIKGPKTQLKNPTGIFLDSKNDELWVSNMGNHRATIYRRGASGDAAPLRVIRSAPEQAEAQMIGNPGALGYDSKREQILVPN